jgi:hypothetical protein
VSRPESRETSGRRAGSEAVGCVSRSRQDSFERLILTRSLRLLTATAAPMTLRILIGIKE